MPAAPEKSEGMQNNQPLATFAGLWKGLQQYQIAHPSEAETVAQFEAFLEACELAGDNPYCRSTLYGHITASAFVVSPDFDQCVLVHHGVLDRWLQPGGHCDGEPDIIAAAVREVEEETGLKPERVFPAIFDLDCHPIPERPSKAEPAHNHYDIRFLMVADPADKVTISDESHDVCWVSLGAVASLQTDQSVLGMVDKISQWRSYL